jgi:adenine-specific DNA-methyltransferase
MQTSFNEAFENIKKLVDNFENNYNYYKSPKYQEAEVRKDFLDPFLIALGCDVNHEHQKNPYKQEVKVEKTQKQEGSKGKKFADYAFYLDPDYKNPVFFVEAKKPAVLLQDNTQYYLQTHKYGWNSQTPLSILTDFEEFIVIDCRAKPHPKYSANAAVKTYNFKDYKNEEVFREIYYLFSREAVADNSINHFVETQIPKRKLKERQLKLFGGGYKAVDDDFLEYIDQLRLDLARAFYNNNPELTPKQLTEATQKTIDRLVFIRFLEDKQIEFEDYINELKEWKSFVQLSHTFDGKYNGIVFKESIIDKPNFKGANDDIFYDICQDISSKESPYNFNAIPVHILGSIYERFLGKIVTVNNGIVDIEFKPEVRKAGGVFYTPKYVVDYIIENSVGKLIKGKTPKEIDDFSFADISCGSGSFLIGVYEYLIDYHKNYYQDKLQDKTEIDGRSDDDGNAMFVDGAWVLTLKRKQEILLNNVFGVDIDNQAVEVSQLSLFLKLLEDDNFGTTTKSGQITAFSKVLPDLTQNIRSGNSLVCWDITEDDSYTLEQQKEINPFDYKTSFPKVFKNGGFDAIVGNPPYLKELGNQEVFAPVEKSEIGKKYHKGKMDFWYYFVHKAANIVKEEGYVAYITNSYWMRSDGASLLRKHIKEDLQVVNLVDFENAKVFKDVSGKHNISIFRKGRTKEYNTEAAKIIDIKHPETIEEFEKYKISVRDLFDSSDKIKMVKSSINFRKYQVLDNFYDTSVGVQESTDKISKKQFEKFPTAFPVNTGVFVLTKEELDKLNLTKEELKIVKPYVSSTDVIKYGIKEINEYLIYADKIAKEKIADNDYPNLKEHLDKLVNYISSSNKPYGIHRPRKEMFFEEPKLICKGMFLKPQFHLDKSKIYCGFSFSTIIQKNKKYSLEFLLGLMNSKFAEYWFNICGKKRGVGVDIGVKVFRQFPIPNLKLRNADDKLKVKEFEDLVKKIIETVKLRQQSTTSSDEDFYDRKIKNLENQINAQVYKLYDLSDEEIAVIENG